MMNTQDTAFFALRPGVGRAAMAAQPGLFSAAQLAPRVSESDDEREAGSECGEKIAWTHEEVVMLHGILFDTCVEKLDDPETPLDEVLDYLRWIFSEPGKEAQAFSFANTLKLYQRPHPRLVREAIRTGLAPYLRQRLTRYPPWVAEAFWSDPDGFADELERNPQWVNETLRRHSRAGDLFAA